MEKWMVWDYKILFALQRKKSDRLDRIMVWFTELGNFAAVWLIFAGYLMIFKDSSDAINIVCVLGLTAFINNLVIKSLYHRKRPCDRFNYPMLIKRPLGSSFPSGHTATSFACVLPILRASSTIGIIALVIACMIALSRIYLFVHFPSDVIFGIISGVTLGTTGMYVIHYIIG